MSVFVDQRPPHEIPGLLQASKVRELPDGTQIVFEYAPAGWTTKDGKPRQRDWRAYFAAGPDGKRKRLISVTTLLEAICPSGGLPVWAEARGIEGAVRAVQLGEIDPADDASRAAAVDTVRALRLGADAARDEAATRGLNSHDCIEQWMLDGVPPRLADHPVEHHGYIQALTRWLLDRRPEPVAIEELVADPVAGYAGRLDLRARIDGALVTVDFKTQERAGIYRKAHWQAAMYERAARVCGAAPAEGTLVVVFAADGRYREMPGLVSVEQVDVALAYWEACRPVDSACESANRREKQARAAA